MISTVFFQQLEFLHTVCKNLENRLACVNTTVEEVRADCRQRKDKFSFAMATVMDRVMRDSKWLSLYPRYGEKKPDNFEECYKAVCRLYYREEALKGLRAYMDGVRYAQELVVERYSYVVNASPMSRYEIIKQLYDDREGLMRWMAEEYLDTAMDSSERRELDRVVLAIKACDYADDLDSAQYVSHLPVRDSPDSPDSPDAGVKLALRDPAIDEEMWD